MLAMAKSLIAAILAISTLSGCVGEYPKPGEIQEPENERAAIKRVDTETFERIAAITGNYLTFSWE